jgi:hypothetical protein
VATSNDPPTRFLYLFFSVVLLFSAPTWILFIPKFWSVRSKTTTTTVEQYSSSTAHAKTKHVPSTLRQAEKNYRMCASASLVIDPQSR